MSFYGQTIYEFSKLFDKFQVGDMTVSADERWDTLNFQTKNNGWIILDGKNGIGEKSIIINHKEKNSEVELIPLEIMKVSNSDNSIQLNFGDIIRFSKNISKFDKAGHYDGKSTDITDLILPIIDIQDIESGNKENIDYGESFTTYEIKFENGKISAIPTTYTLPGKFEAADVADRVVILEGEVDALQEKVKKIDTNAEYIDANRDMIALNKENIQKNAYSIDKKADISLVGDLNEIYKTIPEDATIAKAIGVLENFYMNEEDEKPESVVEALQLIKNTIIQIQSLQSNFSLAITALDLRLKTVEDSILNK